MQRTNPLAFDTGRFDERPERSYTLPAGWYTEPAVFEAERREIFGRSWQFAGHVEQIAQPGDYITVHLLDQNIFIIRGKDGVIRGFHNVCQHRAHELLAGSGNVKVITCPYHAWSYHLDGGLRTARGSERVAGFDAGDFCLKSVQIEIFNDFLFVNFVPEAVPLEAQAGDLGAEMRAHAPDLGRLTHAHRLTYELEANWKIIVDNFLECYHCPIVHPAFVELVDMASYRVVTHGIWSSHHAGPGKESNSAYDFSVGDVRIHAVWWLWPNMCFLRFPGSGNMMVLHILPVAPDRTFETYDFYFLDKAPNAQQREAIAYIDDVLQPEDIVIVESVQRGLRSRGYDQGRFMAGDPSSGYSEHGVHHFHSLLAAALGG